MNFKVLLTSVLIVLNSINCIGQIDTLKTIPTIEATSIEAPLDWALMQQQLIRSMEDAGDFYWQRFMNEGGTTIGSGPYDDLYEMFFNWPEFYMIGAKKDMYSRALAAYNGITRKNTPHFPDEGDYFHKLYKEFPPHDDFFHISEGMTLFYNLALGNPAIPENIERAKRFAGFYLNEDPEAPNFDQDKVLMRSIFTGSRGPLLSSEATYNLRYGHASLYPVIENLEPEWHESPSRAAEIQAIYDSVVTRTDVPVNLGATGLITNAYLYTGDKKYKKWVLDYVDAWMKRIDKNNGILPDNIGLNGDIGEYRNGQWWGGLYGWYGRYGLGMMFASLSVATECAYLLSGDEKYLNLLRNQIDLLMKRAITTKEGQVLVPYRRNQDGWHSYRPMMIRDLTHLWHASMDKNDWDKIETVRKGQKFRPLNGEGIWGQNTLDHLDNFKYKPSEPFDWNKEMIQGDRTLGKSEYARLMYYAGENPDWPFEALKADYQEMTSRMEFMRNDPRAIEDINKDDTYPNNPVILKALQQTTMGTPQTIYFGGLPRGTVRYYDVADKRPGLPSDVSALVEKLEDEMVAIRLVNLHPVESKELIIQAGVFGEHQFTNIQYNESIEDKIKPLNGQKKSTDVHGKYVKIKLFPSTSILLEMGLDRFSNDPSYRFPWHDITEN